MFHSTNHRHILPALIAAVALLAGLAGAARAQGPRVGDVQRLPVVTLSLQVGSTEQASKSATYTPPPGWYIRSHSVECQQKYGHASYSVSTVPPGWTWASDDRLNESYRQLIEAAGKVHDVGLQARLEQDRDETVRERRNTRVSHHALVVEATARGEGLFRGPSGIQLTVTAELVYVGTDLSKTATPTAAVLPSREAPGPRGRLLGIVPEPEGTDPADHRPGGARTGGRGSSGHGE
jgi:hypothetical protein